MPEPTAAPDTRPRGTRETWHRIRPDVEASLVVFLVALPLSLGIAVASGAPVVAGIVAAVVGGVVGGLLGGVPLVVTGPAAGLTAVVAGLVIEHGWPVTCLITALAGVLQIGLGLSRVARAALAISPAVVHGMLAGIGVTIVLGQLHVLLGGDAHSSALRSLGELPRQLLSTHTASALLGMGTVAATLLWPRVPGRAGRALSRVPAPLAAVTLLTAASTPFDVERIELPDNLLSALRLPALPEGTWGPVLLGVVTVALVASVESVLSAVAVEKMAAERLHEAARGDLDRELVGQGAANALSGLVGGLPVTGVIVRSSTNVRAGARTRLSAVLHAVWVALFSVLLVAVVRQIPLSVLAGLLVVIGIGLVDLGQVRTIARHGEALVWLTTVAGVVALNLLEGVLLGIGASLFFAVRRTVFAPVEVFPPQDDAPDLARRAHSWRVTVGGSVTFMSVPRLARQLARVPAGAPVRLEVAADYLDHAAADHLLTWVDDHRRGGGPVEVEEPERRVLSDVRAGRPPRQREAYEGPPAVVAPWPSRPDQLLAGVERYHESVAPAIRPVLHDLRGGQRPTTLFVTCADSRLVPNLITYSGPGDLFTVRNVGNLVPRARRDSSDSTLAALEYALQVLEVSTIAVCGHTGCGAMQALLDRSPHPGSALDGWLDQAALPAAVLDEVGTPSPGGSSDDPPVDRLGMANVVQQLTNLRDHDLVARRLEAGSLTLVGMFFDIAEARMRVLRPETGRFEPLTPELV